MLAPSAERERWQTAGGEDADIERDRAAADDGRGWISTVLHHEVGLTLEFQYEDFYAGIRAGDQIFHL